MLLKRLRLTDQIAQAIKDRIFAGTLRPGDRVVEQGIAREFGTGQNAVREALIELAHLGYVRRIPNKGTFVTSISADEARRIWRLRSALEGLAIDLIIERMQFEKLDLQEASNELTLMRSAAEKSDIEEFYEHDIRFHRMIWRLSGNEYLEQLLEQIVMPLFAFFIMVNLQPGSRIAWFVEMVAKHQEVVKTLESDSPKDARSALTALLQRSLEQQEEIIASEERSARAGAAVQGGG